MIRQRFSMSRKFEMPVRRTIRRHQLREMVPLADSTIYEMEQRGEFPRRFALSPRCVVWDLAEVEEWLAARRAKPIARAKHPDVKQRVTRPVKLRGPAQTLAPAAE
jgi:prophage regulatory protein